MAGRSALLTRSGTQTLISWITRTDSAERFELAVGDYVGAGYLPDATPQSLARDGVPMRWVGTAATTLGLQGEASPRAAARVLTHGIGPQGEKLRTDIKPMPRKDPRTGEEIPQERRETVGWVLSAPKTVSLLLISNESDVRNAAIAALEKASEVAIRELEQQVTVRRGAKGVRSEGVRGLVGIKALHYTSSAGDPHLHVHYILNASAPAQSDGKWRALDSRVLFAAQRVAEAAFQATLKDELSRRLNLAEDAWTKQAVGSAPTWEITALLPAVERFSRARAHMADIAHRINHVLSSKGLTRKQDALIWALHRQDKAAIAEALEHAMDAAIAQGGTAGEALRQEWRRWLGEQKAALDRIAARPRVADAPDQSSQVTQIRSILDGSAFAQRAATRERADQAVARADAALRDFAAQQPYLWGGGGKRVPQSAFDRWAKELQDAQQIHLPLGITVERPKWLKESDRVQALRATIAVHQQFNELWDARKAAQQTAQAVRDQTQTADTQDQKVLQPIRGLAANLGQRIGPFTASDVVAHFRGLGLSLPDARTIAAETLRFWHREGLIHFPTGVDPETLFRTVERGITADTRLQQHVWSHAGKIVSDDLLQREITIAHAAATLAQTHRRALAVDVTGLTPDQARAASLIAEGRALTTIQGVAGAGKSYLLKPVVRAAQRRPGHPMDVLVLSRNAKLAGDLGTELGVASSTLARFRHRKQPLDRPTLLIVDEAGLVDQADWQALLEIARQNDQVQIVAVGDRLQAQPIDRLATWAVVSQAAQDAGAYAELTQSFRNQAWMDEATWLRRGDPQAVYMADDAQRIWAANPDQGADRVAALVLKLTQRGEDALGIAATNEEAAAIATAIQQAKGITRDPRTRLRWDQQTGVGDTVRTRKNERAAKIRNGDTWQVLAVDDQGLRLQAADGRRVRVSHAWARDHLELAYAATVDSAQGVTVDRTVLWVSPLLGQTRLYSAATRGRQAPVYVAEVDPHRPVPTRVQAREAVEAAVLRNDLARTMHEILQRAHRDLQHDLAPPRTIGRGHGFDLGR